MLAVQKGLSPFLFVSTRREVLLPIDQCAAARPDFLF